MEPAKWPILKNAPIKEAIIDLQVKGIEEFSLERLPTSISGFPNRSEILDQTIDFTHKGNDFSASQRSSFIGVRFDSDDQSKVIQFRRDGFTFSMLPPYSEWKEMREMAQNYWRQYTQCLKPKKVVRIATRYINLLTLPSPVVHFEEYLTSPPSVPEGLPNRMSSFLTRTVLHDTEHGLSLILTQALKKATDREAPITLDFDVFKKVSLDAESEEVWKILDHCRVLKNRAFFQSLTKTTLEMFK